MSNDYTPRKEDEAFALPPVPDHPESCVSDYWSPYELSAISAYGHACAEHARVPLAEENTRLKERLRSVCQTLVTTVGADGPCDAEDAAARAVARIAELEAENQTLTRECSDAEDESGRLEEELQKEHDESDRLRAEVEALRAALTECADDLEAEVNARASGEQPRRIERDLEPVRKARALLAQPAGTWVNPLAAELEALRAAQAQAKGE